MKGVTQGNSAPKLAFLKISSHTIFFQKNARIRGIEGPQNVFFSNLY